ncbi:MAG: hypothetical protein ACLQMU_05245 [Methanoregula sp.]|uniref:hypothetical protein n=1 Tax=Methanoregula sp. TaxID=2052170 RepID=UPI003FD87C42
MKLHEKITHPDRAQNLPSCIIKIEDFLLTNGKPNLRVIHEIRDSGGLREFLDTSSQIIFSSIIPDPLLERINLDTYRYLNEEFQPEFYITPDGPTYSSCKKYSRDQIDLVLELTAELMRQFPDSTPIGLIKGCNFAQMDFHSDKLRELGVSQFCLHAGDCLCNAPTYAKDLIVDCGRSLAEKVPDLMIYGVGSRHTFQRFHYAKKFATNSHYMQTFKHRVIQGATWTAFKGDFTKRIVMQNFNYLRRLVEQQSDTQEITAWITDASNDECSDEVSEISSIDRRILKILENG